MIYWQNNFVLHEEQKTSSLKMSIENEGRFVEFSSKGLKCIAMSRKFKNI